MFKKKFLIVFEQVPETTDLFFVEATPEEEAKLNLCHKHYMNNGEDDEVEEALEWLNNRLAVEDWLAGKWGGVDIPVIATAPVSVIITGFLL